MSGKGILARQDRAVPTFRIPPNPCPSARVPAGVHSSASRNSALVRSPRQHCWAVTRARLDKATSSRRQPGMRPCETPMWFCAMGEKTLGEGALCVYSIGSMQGEPHWKTEGMCIAEERRKNSGEEQRALHERKSSPAPKMQRELRYFDRLCARSKKDLKDCRSSGIPKQQIAHSHTGVSMALAFRSSAI